MHGLSAHPESSGELAPGGAPLPGFFDRRTLELVDGLAKLDDRYQRTDRKRQVGGLTDQSPRKILPSHLDMGIGRGSPLFSGGGRRPGPKTLAPGCRLAVKAL
jgi:hypothetical protein